MITTDQILTNEFRNFYGHLEIAIGVGYEGST